MKITSHVILSEFKKQISGFQEGWKTGRLAEMRCSLSSMLSPFRSSNVSGDQKRKFNIETCLYVLLISTLISGTGFCEENKRITAEVDGRPKQYDVIETKRYEIVEVEESPATPDAVKSVAEQAIVDAEKDAVAHLIELCGSVPAVFSP